MQRARRSPPEWREIEQRGQLRDDDVDRDAGQKSRRHGRREEACDPAQPRQPACDQDRPHGQSERGRERAVSRGALCYEKAQRAGEDGCDGRIGAGGEIAVGAEECEGERAGDEDNRNRARAQSRPAARSPSARAPRWRRASIPRPDRPEDCAIASLRTSAEWASSVASRPPLRFFLLRKSNPSAQGFLS